ncbi:MAG: hypothetical protein U9M94_01540 [Patescibacteria group bacterium]|nr:hypothetical protein [Patescibacteria group bacterium]
MENDKFREEIECAKKEFFDSPEDGIIISIDEKYEPYFIEWLVFDFRLKNGESLLEDYYDRNPRKRPLYEMQIYRDLQDNVYGMVEVQKVYPGEGLDLLMLHTGGKYHVREHSATHQLKKNNVIYSRIAKIGDHFELVGADSFILPVRMDSQTKKYFINKKKKFTPKDAVDFFKKDKGVEEPPLPETADIENIKIDFDKLLDDLDIKGMISAGLVQKWLANINFNRTGAPLVDILVGLVEHCPDESQMNRMLDLTSALANHSPQKALKGKSPQEMFEDNKHMFGSKGFDTSVRRIGGEWPDYANKAASYLKDAKVLKALDYFEKTFKTLLKEKTTGRYIFSVFANTGICYLHFGCEFIALKLLSISLELNQDYEFGKNMLAKLDRGEGTEQLATTIRFTLKRARVKELKEFWKKAKNYSDAELRQAYYEISLADCEAEWEDSPAKKYYDFLQKLEIDFSGV